MMAVTSTMPVTSLSARVAQPLLKRRPPPNGSGFRSKDHLEGMDVALHQFVAAADTTRRLQAGRRVLSLAACSP